MASHCSNGKFRMKVVRVSLTALMLASAAFCSQLLDQYKPHDGDLPTQRHRNARTTDVHSAHLSKLQTADKGAVEKVQVSSVAALFDLDGSKFKKRKLRKRAIEELKRKRRNYFEWPSSVVETPAALSFTVWQPPLYQVSRPYYIPVWGSSGRLPIYFPPQPLPVRPFGPETNVDLPPYPPKEYLPPKGYLPPPPPNATTPPTEDGVTLDNRFGEEDDRPVWGVVGQGGSQNRPTTPRPTRRPAGRTTTFPPLVHRKEEKDAAMTTPRPTAFATRPPPPPTPSNSQAQAGQALSRCVWAIISCCSSNTKEISYNCFEQLGCTGAFWDSSPCDNDFAKAAIDAASKYYNN